MGALEQDHQQPQRVRLSSLVSFFSRSHALSDRLAKISHNLSLPPSVPASLRNIPTKYNFLYASGPWISQTPRKSASCLIFIPAHPRTSSRLYLLRISVLH